MLGLTVALTLDMGILGAGVAVLASQVVMAAVVTPGLWRVLTADRRRPATEDSTGGDGTRDARRGPGLAIGRDAAR